MSVCSHEDADNEGIAEIYKQFECQRRVERCDCWHEMVVSEDSFQLG